MNDNVARLRASRAEHLNLPCATHQPKVDGALAPDTGLNKEKINGLKADADKNQTDIDAAVVLILKLAAAK